MLGRLVVFALLVPILLIAAPLAIGYWLLRGSAWVVEESIYVWSNWDRPPRDHGLNVHGRRRASDETAGR